jgi:hypothetical protein
MSTSVHYVFETWRQSDTCKWNAHSLRRSGSRLVYGPCTLAYTRAIRRKAACYLNGMVTNSATLPATRAKGVKSLVVLVCWMVWCERNRRTFEGMERTVGPSGSRPAFHRVVFLFPEPGPGVFWVT